ncbi:MAG: ParB/RepB/Spo0J family partition protein [Armatimonadetes bacterium]|nr:ParB/RepB/Spo0J family partition protein [Armatimonadota bacterium]
MAAKSPEIESGTIVLWPPENLIPDPDQPRQEKNWDIEGTAANMVDMRERGLGLNGTGVFQSLTIRLPPGALDAQGRLKPGTKPFIADGEGRWRSANFANEQKPGAIPLLPCSLQDVSGDDAFEIAYYANAFSTQMSDLDHAKALLRIKKRHNLSYNELAARTKHSRDYIRTRLKAVAEDDTLPILEERPDAIWIVRRINQVEKGDFRDGLIAAALKGATKEDIEDTIAAKRAGLTVEQYRAQRDIRRYERAHEKESQSAKSAAPTNFSSATKRPAASSVSSNNFDNTAPPESSSPARPFIGDALDVMTRQMEDAKSGLLSASLTPERRIDLLHKAHHIRALTDELISGLESGQKITASASP